MIGADVAQHADLPAVVATGPSGVKTTEPPAGTAAGTALARPNGAAVLVVATPVIVGLGVGVTASAEVVGEAVRTCSSFGPNASRAIASVAAPIMAATTTATSTRVRRRGLRGDA